MVAISSGIAYRSPLWDSIHRSPISTLQEFLERAEKYMSLDDAIEKIDKGVNPSSSNPPKTNVNGNGNGNENGADGKKRGTNGADHQDDKRTKFRSDKRPKYEPKFTNYNALKASQAEVYLASYGMSPIGSHHHSEERKARGTPTSTAVSTRTMVMRSMSASSTSCDRGS